MEKKISLAFILLLSLLSLNAQNPIELPDGYTFPYWPEYNYKDIGDLHTIQEQPWVDDDHVVDGWDWSFPSFVEPSPRSLLGLQRIINLNRSFEPVNLQFKANSIAILWVAWRDIEPTMGNYDFSQLKSRIEQANSVGSDIILRVLCHARGRANNETGGQAPLWLDDLGVDYEQSSGANINYNPLHPAFHDRYIKLIKKLGEEGIPDMVKAAYVGWASPALGDEGIGPYHDDVQRNADVPEVIERIDTWAEVFEGQEHKVFMGAPLHYGFDKGFGVRRGFVEMYAYQIPSSDLGQYIDHAGYLSVDESAPIIANRGFHGEVNEEYGEDFVSGDNPFILYRFGYTTEGFPYRYFMSSLRLLQMRCTYTHITGHLVPEMLPFIAQELGRTVEDAPSVWSFLNTTYIRTSFYENNDWQDPPRTFTQTEIDEGIEMKNFERWLYQRDATGYETTPAVKILHTYRQWMIQPDKDYDYIARSGKRMGFHVDERWEGIKDLAAVKVTYFDHHAGELKLTYNDGTENITKTQVLTGDEGLKTATFFVSNIAPNAISEHEFDFILEAGDDTENIVVSMVRIVHADESTGQLGTFSLNTSATHGSIVLDPPGGNYYPDTEVTVTAVGDLGYGFESWGGDLTGTENPVVITMDGDKNISAVFTEVEPVELTTYAENGVIVLNPPGGVYNPGTEVTLTVEADLGYVFHSWGGDLTGSEIPATIIMDSDKNVTASFIKASGINLGAEDGTMYIASDGLVYTGFRSTWRVENLGNVVAGTNDPELFKTWTVVPRNTDFSRQFSMPVENGTYQVTLMTSEHDNYYAQSGKRVTQISYEDIIYHETFDTWDAIRAMNTALDITDIVTVEDGELNVRLRKIGDVWDDVPIFHAFKAIRIDDEQEIYTLVTNADNGIVLTNPFGDKFYEGFEVTLNAIPDEGYKFNGWSGSYDGTDNPVSITMDGDKEITALFSLIPDYTLSVIADNGTVAINPDQDTYQEGTVVTLTATPDEGYEFTGWSGDLSGTDNPVTITMDSDKEITALFTLIPTYTLSITAENGTVAIDPVEDTYQEGTVVTLTATPDEGYEFSGWSGDLSGTDNPVSITMDGDKDITALFTIPSYTLSITAENGTVAIDPAGDTYQEGTVVTLTATPDEGYEFTGWSGDLSGTDNPVSITMDGDKEITALFTLIPSYTLTITAENGTVVIDPVGDTYQEGTVVTLTATPDEGYEFSGWSGDLSGIDNPDSIIMDGNKEVIAEFTIITQVDDLWNTAAGQIRLGQNYPNPFSTNTTIPYSLGEPCHVRLTVYNFTGQQIAVLVNEHQEKGRYTYDWKAKDNSGNPLGSGLYLYRLETSNGIFMVEKLIVK